MKIRYRKQNSMKPHCTFAMAVLRKWERVKKFMNKRNWKQKLFQNREPNKSMHNHVYSKRVKNNMIVVAMQNSHTYVCMYFACLIKIVSAVKNVTVKMALKFFYCFTCFLLLLLLWWNIFNNATWCFILAHFLEHFYNAKKHTHLHLYIRSCI